MDIKKLIKQWLIVISLCGLCACASAPQSPSEGEEEVTSQVTHCILEGSIRDYQVLDDSNLIVTASAKQKYHIELSRPAFGLRSSWQLGFSTSTGRICAGFSDIVFDDLGRAEKIRIREIRKISAAMHEKLLIQYGKKKPEITEAPEPVEVDSADVEELD